MLVATVSGGLSRQKSRLRDSGRVLQRKDGAMGSCLFGGSVALVALRSHLMSRRGGMALGSRWRSSWIMARPRVAHQQEDRPDSTGVGREGDSQDMASAYVDKTRAPHPQA